jgi:hypothetical protein
MLLKTSLIRALARDDIPEIAQLWLRSFRHSDQPPSPELKAYFEEIFFENPWYDPALPSLVYQNDQGRIIGFLGVMPRPMWFQGQPLRVAVATQLMVDPQHRGFAALELLRRFFAGTQDLSFSDGASDTARQIWERCGGQTVRLYCLDWQRTLRPMTAVLLKTMNRPALRPLARMTWPLAQLADAMITRLPAAPYHVSPAAGTLDEAISIEDLLACIEASSAQYALRPRYDRESLSWILRQAAQAESFGLLRTAIVREPNGDPAGWCIYYLRPGQGAWLVQFGAEPARTRFVLDHLFAHVQRCGAVGIDGPFDPRYMEDLARGRCHFICPGLGVLVQSRNEQLLNAIHRGDSFLTRLEGEWWLRFGIDRCLDW